MSEPTTDKNEPGAASLAAGESLVALKTVKAITQLSHTSIYKLMRVAESRFPSPIKIGKSTRWSRREIDEWIEARLRERKSAA